MKQIEWANGIGHRGRSKHLILVKNNEMIQFKGESIPSVAVVLVSKYTRNGKWSHSEYTIELAPGVRSYPIIMGWETGTLREALKAYDWVSAANYFGVSLNVVKKFIAQWRPFDAEHWDMVEKEIEELESISEQGMETVIVNIGPGTRRAREEGCLVWPIMIEEPNKTKTELAPEQWITGCKVGNVLVQDVVHHSGYGGGTKEITLVVPCGSTVWRKK
jgi:hypothetical protein